MSTRTIAVIGGGAAGMMTVATLIEHGYPGENITLYEKNPRLGAKVIISGGGRCNITSGHFKTKELLTKYPRGSAFLCHACQTFGPRVIRRWFESHGLALKQESDMRIFPVSDDGRDVVAVFERLFDQHDVYVQYGSNITSTVYDERGFVLTDSDRQEYRHDQLVLCTGGNAYRQTGSTGDGYAFALALGHTITPLGPSLNSFQTQETRLHECSGIALARARVSSGIHHSDGAVLLTHFGITGPAVFALSAHLAFESITTTDPLTISLIPDTDRRYQDRDQGLLSRSQQHPRQSLTTYLRTHLPTRLVDKLLAAHDLPIVTGATLTKDLRKHLSHLLGEGIQIALTQRRAGDEFVTAGGVSLDEVDPHTGESRIRPGLYFAGELLDVDGYTGGYNLTASWAMGRVVGLAIKNCTKNIQ